MSAEGKGEGEEQERKSERRRDVAGRTQAGEDGETTCDVGAGFATARGT